MTFATTQWSLVLATREPGDAGALAFAELCRRYRAPVLAFVRQVRGAADAEDLTQAFFVRLLERRHLGADPQRGRFRNYLLGAVKHFLADMRDEELAAKRGGAAIHVAVDGPELVIADGAPLPDAAFERAFAYAVIGRAMERLRDEAAQRGKAAQLAALSDLLLEPRDTGALKSLAAKLDVRANTLAVSLKRWRDRLSALIRDEVAQTVADPALVDAEMKSLRETLRNA